MTFPNGGQRDESNPNRIPTPPGPTPEQWKFLERELDKSGRYVLKDFPDSVASAAAKAGDPEILYNWLSADPSRAPLTSRPGSGLVPDDDVPRDLLRDEIGWWP